MSNTIKAVSELLIDCADNGNRQITAQTLRNVVISSWNKLDVPHLNSITIDSSGNVTATSFNGVGSSLTALNATQLTTGSVPSARLTSIPAANLTGTIADERLSANIPLKNTSNTFSGALVVTQFAVSPDGSVDVANIGPDGHISFDNGGITSDGNGTLHAAVIVVGESGVTITPSSLDVNGYIHAGNFSGATGGACSFDGGQIATDGNGALTAASFHGDGSNLTNVPLSLAGNGIFYGVGSSIYSDSNITTDGLGNLTVGGAGQYGAVNVCRADGTVDVSLGVDGNLSTIEGPVSLANNTIASDGNNIIFGGANILNNGTTTLDGGNITTDGNGNLTAVTFVGDGSNLTGIYLLHSDGASFGQPYSASSLTTLAAAMRINVGGTDYFIPLYIP